MQKAKRLRRISTFLLHGDAAPNPISVAIVLLQPSSSLQCPTLVAAISRRFRLHTQRSLFTAFLKSQNPRESN